MLSHAAKGDDHRQPDREGTHRQRRPAAVAQQGCPREPFLEPHEERERQSSHPGNRGPDKFPGQLRNQAQVALSELLKPYPQYSSISQTNTPGVREKYHSFQLKAQKPFASGANFLLAYNYNREIQEEFFNDIEEFANVFRFEPAQRPRHRMTIASVYEFPFGKGRRYLSQIPKFVDHIVGGWTASGIYSYNSGTLLRFGALEVSAIRKSTILRNGA